MIEATETLAKIEGMLKQKYERKVCKVDDSDELTMK